MKARGDGVNYSLVYSGPSNTASGTTDLPKVKAPTGLSVDGTTHNSASLSWTAPTGADAYKVEYKKSSSSTWLHARYVYSGPSYTVTGLSASTSYDFRVKARGDGVNYSLTYSGPSNTATGTTPAKTLPDVVPPTGLSVDGTTHNSASLSWTAPTGADAYKVEYKKSSSSTWLHAKYVYSGPSYTVSGLAESTRYDFRVKARGDGVNYSLVYSSPSNTTTGTTGSTVPPVLPDVTAPTGLTVDGTTHSNASLSWTARTGADAYKVEYSKEGSGSWNTHSDALPGTSTTVSGLDCGARYQFQVKARGDGSTYSLTFSGSSNTVTGKTSLCMVAAPMGLTVTTSTDSSVGLRWTTPTGAAALKVEYRKSGSTAWNTHSYIHPGASQTVDGLGCDTEYEFQVLARGDGSTYSFIYSNPSNVETGRTSNCATIPRFVKTSYTFSIPEDATIGATLGTVYAKDVDPGDSVTYSFLSGNSDDTFDIGPTSGTITIKNSLNRQTSPSYVLKVRARDKSANTVYADVAVDVAAPLNIVGDDLKVMYYKKFRLDWIIPASGRSPDHLYKLRVPADTGYQIRPTSVKSCNWSSPPIADTAWVNPDTSFHLIRCKRGTGQASIDGWKKPASSTGTTGTLILTLGPIAQAWHQHDNKVDYLITNPLLADPRPPKADPSYTPISQQVSEIGILRAASRWKRDQSHADFVPASSSHDTTIKGYWNPEEGGTEDRCVGTIACLTWDGILWIEYPPQFPSAATWNRWTNELSLAKKDRKYYYLPQVMMHELGHAAGLGHAADGNVMGGVAKGSPLDAPAQVDLDAIRNVYENHNSH